MHFALTPWLLPCKMEETGWSLELEEKLIDLWEERPCLYDISSKGYSNRNWKKKMTLKKQQKSILFGTPYFSHVDSVFNKSAPFT